MGVLLRGGMKTQVGTTGTTGDTMPISRMRRKLVLCPQLFQCRFRGCEENWYCVPSCSQIRIAVGVHTINRISRESRMISSISGKEDFEVPRLAGKGSTHIIHRHHLEPEVAVVGRQFAESRCGFPEMAGRVVNRIARCGFTGKGSTRRAGVEFSQPLLSGLASSRQRACCFAITL